MEPPVSADTGLQQKEKRKGVRVKPVRIVTDSYSIYGGSVANLVGITVE